MLTHSSIDEIFDIEPQGEVHLKGVSDRERCRPDVRAKGDFKRVASLAQQESQSMSQNIRLGIQYRFQQGKMQLNFSKFLGYTRDEAEALQQQIRLVRKLIEKVIIYDEHFTVIFKSGIDVDIEA